MRTNLLTRAILLGTTCLMGSLAETTQAQIADSSGDVVHVDRDSGPVRSSARKREVIYSTYVESADASWLRVVFDDVEFGAARAGDRPTVLRITSMLDGATQTLDEAALAQWGGMSAFFNGDELLVEMIADPRSRDSRVRIADLIAGDDVEGGVATICGDDDRVLSSDPRVGRLLPEGCTAWLIDDANHCFLTAGHCNLNQFAVVQFNVPSSTAGGALMHPGPEDQYNVDGASVQESDNGTGNDWGYFGCFANTTTALTAFETQGSYFVTAAPPLATGQTLRLTGFGLDETPLTSNQVQQTDTGPYTTFTGSQVRYVVDTRAGNSGGPVIYEPTGAAIGIHTNGGCSGSGGSNVGTAFNNPGLVSAFANPLGVCALVPPAVDFVFPNGLPDLLDPEGSIIRVEVTSTESGEPVPGTGSVHFDDGSGVRAVGMVQVSPNIYDAVLPALDCGTPVTYFFSVDATDGTEGASAISANSSTFTTTVAIDFDATFVDSFQTDTGWSVSDVGGVSSGFWERGVPGGTGNDGDPVVDADGSGNCFVTGLNEGVDVDGGFVTLTSPIMDATAPEAHIVYDWWFTATGTDVMSFQVSDNAGGNWVTLTGSVMGPILVGGWTHSSIRVGDFVSNTSLFQIRFNVFDLNPDTNVEAAIDGVRLQNSADGLICTECPSDVAMPQNGMVDVDDLIVVILAWGQTGVPADVNADGVVNVDDLVELILSWGTCE